MEENETELQLLKLGIDIVCRRGVMLMLLSKEFVGLNTKKNQIFKSK